jgi:hypothetical protein
MFCNYTTLPNHKENLIDFLQNKNFNYLPLKEILIGSKSTLIILEKDISLDEIKKYEDLLNKSENDFILFIPKKFANKNLFLNFKKIFYPINIFDFEKNIKYYFSESEYFFKEIYLEKNSFLVNKNNNKKIYLTETELSLLKFLFKENSVQKQKLKIEILEQKITIDTKSLESHLSRIRKKIKKIDSNVSISSVENNKVFIF